MEPKHFTIDQRPLISLGREICGDLAAALRREWLTTNGLGGYASGTLAGPATRRYHGLLVAALTPPVERTVLVGGALEWASYHGQRYPLCACEYGPGRLEPEGFNHIQLFELEGMLPVWTFALGDALLQKRVWMAYGANTSYVSYQLLRSSGPLTLELTPLTTCRDFHTLTRRQDHAFQTRSTAHEVTLVARAGARPLRLVASAGRFTSAGRWHEGFFHREEAARGQDDDHADLYAPGTFTATLSPGERWTLVLTIEEQFESDGSGALKSALERQRVLLQQAGALQADPVVQQLVLAADQFIVARSQTAGAADSTPAKVDAPGRTIIAGYHWFNDWGRDTMIALPGLTLATGRPADAADILRTFRRYVADGLLPNNFPDQAGTIPGYNTVDATLWYIHAVRAYERATGDRALVRDLLPTLRDIVEQHLRGTRFGIGVDPADGLLRAGEPGLQLTWMDAKIGDWVVTPRIGKPVEINALWYNALRAVAGWIAEQDPATAARYGAVAKRTRSSFRARFCRDGSDQLADVVDGPEGDDWTLRPNQIFAVALPDQLLDRATAQGVVRATARALLTSHGLRSLAPQHPAYCGRYLGTPAERDSVYHQGPVWSWLIGPYVEAVARVGDDATAARELLRPFRAHLHDACLGSVSEILEGDPPHLPRGAVAQAWGVAEVLRVWRMLEELSPDI